MERYFCYKDEVKVTLSKGVDAKLFNELILGFSFHSVKTDLALSDRCEFSIGEAPQRVCENTLYVTENGVYMRAENEQILIRGFISFLRKIELDADCEGNISLKVAVCEEEISLPKIHKMAHLLITPAINIEDTLRKIRLCGVLGYTHIIVEFVGVYRFESLPECAWKATSHSKEELQMVFREIRNMGMEPVPMFNSLGHAAGHGSGKHVVLEQSPHLAYLFTPDGWCWNVARTDVREVLRKIRWELYEICGECKFFHLGGDEFYSYGVKESDASVVADCLAEVCREVIAEGKRPLLWADMMLYGPDFQTDPPEYECNAPSRAYAETLLADLPRETVLCDWHYGARNHRWATSEYLMAHGFDVITCAWFDNPKNIDSAVLSAENLNAFGFMQTSWGQESKKMYLFNYAMRVGEDNSDHLRLQNITTDTATLWRKVWHVIDDYSRSGWARN